jgi:superfamily II RNA helicase
VSAVPQPLPGRGGRRRPDLASVRRTFLAGLPFAPDAFQLDAIDAIDGGRSVLVSAPTGSGKTLVAAYGVHRTLAGGAKAFYTTPLKALSNQKYRELSERYGTDRVGLLTGDSSIRPEAPVVVMTTEVLRNMLLAGSDLLADLQTVVLDEVHYLQDPYRGAVWEEVLVLSPPEVRFICLSATVNNATELGDWLRSVRGATEVVVEQHRPITLRHHFAVHRRDDDLTVLLPLLNGRRADAECLRVDQAVRRATATRPPQWRGGRGPGGPRLPYRSPRRTELLVELDEAELLPAIVFIFSRAACDDAVRQCLRDGVRLTDRNERAMIRRTVEASVDHLGDDDLEVLGYADWLEGLEAGIAAHHAGMVPAFREAVETLFSAGLLRVVFATETLSLGINMPARTVVIERFTKFGSSGRAPLTSGEYAQLTGRAGRRGLDDEGHAVVVWSPETTLADAARIAVAAPPDLRSAFRPTYNLAVNLVRRFDRSEALDLLRRSFGQWQASRRAPTGAAAPPSMADLLGRRLAVLEELGYVRGWQLTPPGSHLSRIYHGSDLLVAEILTAQVLSEAEPSVLAGVLSAFVFERRRARSAGGTSGHPDRRGRGGPPRRPAGTKRGRGEADRLGERRRLDLARRIGMLDHCAERIRGVEEARLVPRTRQPDGGLAGAVTSWARGASFATVLEVAGRDGYEVAPGDFVRIVKEVADLVGQVATVAADPQVAAAADAAQPLLLRGVVAAGGAVPSALPGAGPF